MILRPACTALGLLALSFTLSAQSFTSPGLGSDLENPSDLVLQNLQFTETVQPDTRVLVEITADLMNNDLGEWQEAKLTFGAPENGLAFEVTDSNLEFGSFLGNATNSPLPSNSSVAALVDAADVVAFKASLQTGEHLTLTGFELFVFSREPAAINEETSDLYDRAIESGPGEKEIVFTASTPFLASLAPGQLLVEDPSVFDLPNPEVTNPFGSQGEPQPSPLQEFLPFEITGVRAENGSFIVTGIEHDLLDVLKSATIVQDADDAFGDPNSTIESNRPFYDPPLENTYTDDEEEVLQLLADVIESEDPRDERLPTLKGLRAIPIKFNEVEITPKLKLSGEVLLHSSGLQLEIKIRRFKLKRAVVHLDAGVTLNAVVEVGEEEDNTDAPEAAKSKTIAEVPLPPVVISIAGFPLVFQPVFSVNVGAEVSTPTKIAFPIQSGVLVGMDMGWDSSRPEGDKFFYEPTHEFVTPRISNPSVFEEVAITASAFAEAAFNLYVGPPPVPSLTGPSSGFAVRTTGEATISPFSDPWWEMDFDLDLTAHAEFNFFGINAADTEGTLVSIPLYSIDAGGPLALPGPAPRKGLSSPPDINDFRSRTGRRARWARAFETSLKSGHNDDGFGFFLPDVDDEVLVASVNSISNSLNKFTAEGEVLWSKSFNLTALPLTGVPEPGGGFTLAGSSGSEIWIASFDNDGNRLWHASYRPDNQSAVERLIRAENASGQAEYFLTGHRIVTSIRTSDPLLMKFDAGGALLWTKYYQLPGHDDEAFSIVQSNDGDLVLCGRTGSAVAPPLVGTPDTNVILFNSTPNFLLMKVSSQDGSVLWANSYVSHWGGDLQDLVEGPDGSIYACGEVNRPVNVDYPVNLVAHFAADGRLLDHVSIGEDPDTPDDLPTGGNTPSDHADRIVWCDGNLYVCGTTGMGTSSTGWVASLTEELGVRWWSIFDGADSDTLFELACSEDSIMALGSTRSILPWGYGGSGATLLLSLPHEGVLRFHKGAGASSLYLQPQVFKSSAHPDFVVTSTTPGTDGNPPMVHPNSTSPVTFAVTDLVTTPGTREPVLSDITLASNYYIEEMAENAIQGFTDWAMYQQLPEGQDGPNDNHDDDHRTNGEEFYFGGSPFAFDGSTPQLHIFAEDIEGDPHAILEFARSNLAAGLDPIVNASTNLTSWVEVPYEFESTPIDDDFDLLRLAVPFGVFKERYFTVESPEQGP